MAFPQKSVADITVLALQSIAASTVLISSEFDVSAKFGAKLFFRFGRRAATAAGAGVRFRVETAAKASGAGAWIPYSVFETDFAACEAEAITGTQAIGAQTLTVASTAGLAIGDVIFIDNGTILNSEWHRIKSFVVNTSITLEEPILNAQTGSTLYNKAEPYAPQLDLMADKRIRLVVDGSRFTQAFAVQAFLITTDVIA